MTNLSSTTLLDQAKNLLPKVDFADALPHGAPMPDVARFGHVTSIHPYFYADATISHLIVRIDPADGSSKQIRPLTYVPHEDGQGGEWVCKFPPKPRPLYRLPQVITCNKPILVVEGEKTADAAATLFPDFTVTTSGSATSAASVDWSHVAGRVVTVLPDNDEPGRNYAKAVAKHAYAADASEVRIVQLPQGLLEGWDAADVFPPFFSLADLQKLVAGAPKVPMEEALAPTRRGPLLKLDMNQLRDSPCVPRKWLWDDLIPLGVPGLLGAVSDHGKTSLLLQIAAGVAIAKPVLGRATLNEPGGVLMVFLEDDSAEEVKPRVDSVAETFTTWTEEDEANYRKNLWPYVPNWDYSLDTSFGRLHEDLDHQLSMMVAAGIKPALVIIDTFAAVSDGSENDASSSRVLWAVARSLSRKYGVTVIFSHHLRKEGQIGKDRSPIHERLHPSMMRGSSANEGAARFIVQLGWITWDEAEKTDLDPEKAYNLGYAIGRVSKVKAAKPEMLFLDRIDPGEAGQGCFRLHPRGEEIVATLFRNRGKLKELGLQFQLLVAIRQAKGPIDREALQEQIFGNGPKARKALENALSRLRKNGYILPRAMQVSEQGIQHIQEMQASASQKD
jgi:hypothetical protein